MMRVIGIIAAWALVACAGPRNGGPVPLRLGARAAAVPPPGLCRVWTGEPRAHLARGCDGIEFSAPLGAEILYRPDDDTRSLVVCFLSRTGPREIIGMDLYDIDTRRLVRVLQSVSDAPRGPSCRDAYHGPT